MEKCTEEENFWSNFAQNLRQGKSSGLHRLYRSCKIRSDKDILQLSRCYSTSDGLHETWPPALFYRLIKWSILPKIMSMEHRITSNANQVIRYFQSNTNMTFCSHFGVRQWICIWTSQTHLRDCKLPYISKLILSRITLKFTNSVREQTWRLKFSERFSTSPHWANVLFQSDRVTTLFLHLRRDTILDFGPER